jgi:uncharacterized membrane protein
MESFLLISYTSLLLFLLQLASVGLVMPFVGKYLPDHGWSLGRIALWLFTSLILWFLGHIGIAINTDLGTYLVVMSLAVVSGINAWQHRDTVGKALKQKLPLIISFELLFYAGFILLAILRSIKPEILDLEKFMDAGFMASYLRSPLLPAPDMWLAGESINYYSFGHFMGSVMLRIWRVKLEYGYNLLLALMMAITLSMSCMVIVTWIKLIKPKASLTLSAVAAAIGGLWVTFGGNMHTVWYALSNGNWEGYWYASATRFIDRTIHEFPAYSFIVSDIHGHVWDLPIVFSFLMLAAIWFKQVSRRAVYPKQLVKLLKGEKRHLLNQVIRAPSMGLSILLGVLIGVMSMTNAWDVAIYGLLLIMCGILLVSLSLGYFIPLLLSALVMGGAMILTALPFLLTFESISEGVAIATENSPLWQLAVLWSGHVFVSFLALVASIKTFVRFNSQDKKSLLFVIAAIFTAWSLILIPELIFVKDIYTGHPRANTMFKLTYQGFILMTLLGGFLVGLTLTSRKLKRIGKLLAVSSVMLVFTCSMTFFYFGSRDYFGFDFAKPLESLQKYQGLYGLTWLETESVDDYKALNWLQENISGQPILLEAVGESYTTFNRFSAFTGIPSVLGWRVHEWLWRGGFDIPGQRTEEVKTMYEQPLSVEAQRLYDVYNVAYIIVGSKENEIYDIDPEIFTLGNTVFRSGETTIIKREQKQ